jgi:histidine ammonia-lyase
MDFTLKPGQLTLTDCRMMANFQQISLDKASHRAIQASAKIVNDRLSQQKPIYGLNTGFGSLAHTHIDEKNLSELHRNLILSHSAGTGEYLSDGIVRFILLLKINSLARGFSGIRLETIQAFLQLLNARVYPCIPAQGSVGASGDLAPLAHLSAVLLGFGQVRHNDKILDANEGLKIAKLTPLTLAPKEGLALINGTQASTALLLQNAFRTENILLHALIAGALTTDALLASHQPFDARIQEVRGLATQKTIADILRDLLKDSEMHASHHQCEKVQDPYSVRCQPQVMGACLAQLLFAADTLLVEINAVTDNPLVFSDDNEILSGGNFHAEPIAMMADGLALAIAEIGALSERRIALLIDPNFSQLPPFLVNHSGVNSGFMIAQVTAAALASENKSLAHPASVDSIPTSANQEDHVSMATFAARRLGMMIENTMGIIAIELLAASQAIDFRRPLKTSVPLEKVHKKIREIVPFYEHDRFFAPDIEAVKSLVRGETLRDMLGLRIF